MKVIVWQRSDNKVEITPASPSVVAKKMAAGMTEDEAIEAIKDRALLLLQRDRGFTATNVEVLEASDIPGFNSTTGVLEHHEFRDALVKSGVGAPTIDMPKARVIHAGRIHSAKLALARELLEREVLGENVAAEKATLAAIDVQPQVNSAANPTALAAVWPAPLDRFR